MSFTKTCKICGNTFESDSRNTIYCSEKCAKRGAKKAYRARKMKHVNAVRRGDEQEIENLITAARRLSRDIAQLCLHKVCSCTDKDHICEGSLVVHHKDHNPCNCDPSNLMWLCEKAHNDIHSHEEDCSVVDEMKAYITIRKQAEIRQRNKEKQMKENNSLQE